MSLGKHQIVSSDSLHPQPDEPKAPKADQGMLRYASLWSRAAACLVDFAILAMAVVPAAILLTWIMDAIHEDLGMKVKHASYLSGIGAVALWVLSDWYYQARMLSSEWGATVGKRIFGVYVVGGDGERVTFWQASARHYSKFLSTFLLGIGFAMAAFSKRRQGLHDVVANTIVRDR